MWYNVYGGCMRVAVDKSCVDVVKNYDYDFIYLFDDESLKELVKSGFYCVHYKKCGFVDINLTGYDIECTKKAKVTDKDWDKLPEIVNFKIGVIVPNYNYSHTLEKCLNSILSQTYDNYEIIFVDDMSTDDSIEIAKRLLKPPHKIVELKQKRYNGGARNEAYLHLSDDISYIYYIDSDDWLKDETVFEKINNKLQKRPDVLFVGISKYEKGKIKDCLNPDYKNKYEAMQGWSGSCGKVIKKELATRQDCLYAEGTLKEDRNQHYRVCIKMNNFECLKDSVYVWNRENSKSITTIRDNVLWGTSTIRHYADTKQLYLEEQGKDKKVDEILRKRITLCKQELRNGGDRQW